jgi:hypothetical protein
MSANVGNAEKALDAMFSDDPATEEPTEKPDSPRTKLRKKRLALKQKRTNEPRRMMEAVARATGDPSKKAPKEKDARKEMRAKQRQNVQDAWSALGLAEADYPEEKKKLLNAMASNNTVRAQEIIASVTANKRDRDAADALFTGNTAKDLPLG